MRTLLIGYGNCTRSDDGVGIRVAEEIRRLGLAGVETRTSQQLHVDILEDFCHYSRMVLVDVSPGSRKVEILKVSAAASGMASSHHLSAELLLSLAQAIGYDIPQLYVCRIPGEDFNFGTKLSARTLAGAEQAKKKIKSLLQTWGASYARS